MKKICVLVIILSIIIIPQLKADLIEDLSKFSKKNGKGYLKPIATSLTTNINTGWFTVAKGGLMHFGVTVNPILTLIPDDKKAFTAYAPDTTLYEEHSIESATFFGEDGATFHSNISGVPDLTLPDGYDVGFAPFLIPQFHFGLPSNFDVQFRFMPEVEISKDFGKINFWGIGVKNQISELIPLCPVAIALQGTYQQLSVGDVIDFNTTYFNVQASKSLIVLPFTVYGGLGVESSTLSAKYDYEGDIEELSGTKIDFEVDTDSQVKLTLGTRMKILVLDLVVDYSIGEYSTIRAGIGASFKP